MVKLLVAGVLVVVLGVVVARMSLSGSAPADPVQAQTEVDKARQDVNSAMDAEKQRASALDNFGAQPTTP